MLYLSAYRRNAFSNPICRASGLFGFVSSMHPADFLEYELVCGF